MESGASLLMLEDLSWMHNLKSAGGSVDEAELVIREIGRLHAAWWGDVRLDQTLAPDEGHDDAPRGTTGIHPELGAFLDKLSVPVTKSCSRQATL